MAVMLKEYRQHRSTRQETRHMQPRKFTKHRSLISILRILAIWVMKHENRCQTQQTELIWIFSIVKEKGRWQEEERK